MFSDFTQVQRLEDADDVRGHPLISLEDGRHSWYSGYYHGGSFASRLRYALDDRTDWNGTPLDRLRIGNFCQFASGVTIALGGNHGHDLDLLTPHAFNFFPGARDAWAPVGDTVIGHDVWIGYEALILPGVRIGTGAVIGARAVVAKDIEPYAVVVGDGRVVKYRFAPQERELLQRIAWWEWDDERIADALLLIQGSDLHALAEYAEIE